MDLLKNHTFCMQIRFEHQRKYRFFFTNWNLKCSKIYLFSECIKYDSVQELFIIPIKAINSEVEPI